MGNCIEKIFRETSPVGLRKSSDKKALRYFYPVGGCLGLFIKGYNADQMRARVQVLLFAKISKEKAIEKVGLDPDEVKEMPSCEFGGWAWYKRGDYYVSRGGITADYDHTYCFSTASEVLLVNYSLNLLNGKIMSKEKSFFYKEINSITIDTNEEGGKTLKLKSFGETFSFAIENESDQVNQTISAIRAKLREFKAA